MSSGSVAILAIVGFHTPATGFAAPADVWSIESGPIDPKQYFGATVANGMIGILSAPAPFRTEQTLINGAYEPLFPGSVSCTVRSFDLLDLTFSIDGVRIDRLEQTRDFRQTLGLKDAVLTTSFDYQDKATIHYTTRALRHLPYTALLEVTVIAKQPITISSLTKLDTHASLETPSLLEKPATFDTQIQMEGASPRTIMLAAASAKVPSGALTIGAAQSFIFDEAPTAAPGVTRRKGGLMFTRQLPAGSTYHFALIGSTLTSAHVLDPLNEAQRLTAAASVEGTSDLIARHESAWADLWKSDIVIEGDDETQRDVRSMIYHLYSFIREGSGYSIAPMGLSRGANGYMGHIFWDAEIWMLPALLALRPELARTMLDYRYDRLPAARKNAAAHGYRGAKFPWESAASGDEDIWSSALTLQIHVTADVGIAAWNYYRVTQDLDWLRERGYPLLKATADFWTSRVARNGPGRYDITRVMGADEYAQFVDNDAFTNAAVKANLAAATAAANILGVKGDPDWEHVRSNIPILRFADGVTREHATYQGEKIKQADVNLLSYPLQEITDGQTIRRDLEYYASRTDDVIGPAMTQAIFATLYQRMGEPEKAYSYFKKAYTPNKRPPFGGFAENATSKNPYFATGAGGVLQSLLYGFGGLEITDAGIVQKPARLPAAWKAIQLKGIGIDKKDYPALRPTEKSAGPHE